MLIWVRLQVRYEIFARNNKLFIWGRANDTGLSLGAGAIRSIHSLRAILSPFNALDTAV